MFGCLLILKKTVTVASVMEFIIQVLNFHRGINTSRVDPVAYGNAVECHLKVTVIWSKHV
jgi:hypothetical protein